MSIFIQKLFVYLLPYIMIGLYYPIWDEQECFKDYKETRGINYDCSYDIRHQFRYMTIVNFLA